MFLPIKPGDHLYHNNPQTKMQNRCRAQLFAKMNQYRALRTVLGNQGGDKVPALLGFIPKYQGVKKELMPIRHHQGSAPGTCPVAVTESTGLL